MIKLLRKELVIYTALLTFLIIVMHPDILSDPIARLGLMQEHSNYTHPLLYTFIIYLVIFFLRAVINFGFGFFDKKEK